VSRVRSIVGAGFFIAVLGATPAGALTRPTAGLEDLCPATKPLTQGDHKHEASVVRSYLGCRVSDDPGPNDPGSR
jgi:hypothetical protein